MRMLRTFIMLILVAASAMAGCSKERAGTVEQSGLTGEISALIAQKGYEADSFNIDKKAAMLTISLFDSKLLLASAQERQSEAADIVSTIQRQMTKNREFESIQTVHVDYLHSRLGKANGKLIDGIEFYRDPDGVLRYHQS
jgi:hypothetical protein